MFAARSAQGCLRNSFQHFGLHTVTVVVHGDSRGIDSDRFQHQTRGHLAYSRTLTQRLSKFLTFGSLKNCYFWSEAKRLRKRQRLSLFFCIKAVESIESHILVDEHRSMCPSFRAAVKEMHSFLSSNGMLDQVLACLSRLDPVNPDCFEA